MIGGQEPAPSSRRRRLASWAISVVGAALLLWLSSRYIDLWPEQLVLPRPWLFVAAAALHLPYAWIRAVRLRFVLDPLVAEASGGAQTRLDWRVLHGSGYLSFFVLMLLPLHLGELSRPLLLLRAREPGVALPESVSAVAVERVVDGLLVVGMLFFGLGFADLRGGDSDTLAKIHAFGQLMALVFTFGLVVLLAAAARPAWFERLVLAIVPGAIGRRLADAGLRIAETVAVLFNWRQGLPFLIWSLIYWVVTVAQLWLVASACGLGLGPLEAAAVVSIVGLAIKLPGGPAQTGSFQIGMVGALALLTTTAEAPNQPNCVMSVHGAEVSAEEVGALDRVCILFDGMDEAAVAHARTQWKTLKDAGASAQYWSEESGRWEKKAET